MGLVERALASERSELHRYRVRKWTAFDWRYPDGPKQAKQRETMRKKNEESLEAAALKYDRKLTVIAPDFHGKVKRVGVKRKPQIMFEIDVDATSRDEAVRKAEYRISRLLKVPIAPNRNQRMPARGKVKAVRSVFPEQDRCLRPPWGKVEVELLA
jgi:hypothetical protein